MDLYPYFSYHIVMANSRKLPDWVLMTDPQRVQPLEAAENLPNGNMIIYRHFGAKDRLDVADALRDLCKDRGHLLLIGQDVALALGCDADGVHLPERDMLAASHIRKAHPNWFMSCAVHSEDAIKKANALDLNAVILSPIFPSQSPSAGEALGAERFGEMVNLSKHPVIALGGITEKNAEQARAAGAESCAGVSMFV